MGNLSSEFGSVKATLQLLPEGVVIVASPTFVAGLSDTSHCGLLADAAIVALDPAEPLEMERMAGAPVAVVEVDPGCELSLARVTRLRQRYPRLPIIAALARADIATTRMLVRHGVTDVAQLPFDIEELAAQVMDAAAEQASEPGQAPLAPMVTVVRSTGGCGATSFATQLAAELGRTSDLRGRVCLLDLDVQGGDATTFLGCEGKVTVADLLEAGERIDADFIGTALVDTGRGFSVIAAPDAISPVDKVDVDQVLRIAVLLRRKFACVIVDLPAAWTDWALSLALASSDLLLVTDMSISSLRQARRRLSLLESVGAELNRVRIVANRVEKRLFKTIGAEEVQDALGCEVVGTLTNEGAGLRIAQDQGLLLSQTDPRSRYVRETAAIAARLRPGWN